MNEFTWIFPWRISVDPNGFVVAAAIACDGIMPRASVEVIPAHQQCATIVLRLNTRNVLAVHPSRDRWRILLSHFRLCAMHLCRNKSTITIIKCTQLWSWQVWKLMIRHTCMWISCPVWCDRVNQALPPMWDRISATEMRWNADWFAHSLAVRWPTSECIRWDKEIRLFRSSLDCQLCNNICIVISFDFRWINFQKISHRMHTLVQWGDYIATASPVWLRYRLRTPGLRWSCRPVPISGHPRPRLWEMRRRCGDTDLRRLTMRPEWLANHSPSTRLQRRIMTKPEKNTKIGNHVSVGCAQKFAISAPRRSMYCLTAFGQDLYQQAAI